MYMEELIKTYDLAVPLNVCDEIMAVFEKQASSSKSLVLNFQGKADTPPSTNRLMRVLMNILQLSINEYYGKYLLQTPSEGRDVAKRLQSGSGPTLWSGTEESESNTQQNMPEYDIFLKFAKIHKMFPHPGHHDFFVCDIMKQSFVTYFVLLNDVEEGGEIEFAQGFKILPKKGTVVIFPTQWFFSYVQHIPKSDMYRNELQFYYQISLHNWRIVETLVVTIRE